MLSVVYIPSRPLFVNGPFCKPLIPGVLEGVYPVFYLFWRCLLSYDWRWRGFGFIKWLYEFYEKLWKVPWTLPPRSVAVPPFSGGVAGQRRPGHPNRPRTKVSSDSDLVPKTKLMREGSTKVRPAQLAAFPRFSRFALRFYWLFLIACPSGLESFTEGR